MRKALYFLLAAILTTDAPRAYGGWGGGACGAVAPIAFASFAQMQAPCYEWHPVASRDPDEMALFFGARQAGVWQFGQGRYLERVAPGQFREAACPTDPPPGWRKLRKAQPPMPGPDCSTGCSCVKCSDDCPCQKGQSCGDKNCRCIVSDLPTGVVESELGKGPPYQICDKNGCHRATREEAVQRLQQSDDKGRLKDDSTLPTVWAIGTEAECKPFLDDMANHPALAQFKNKVKVGSSRPDNWNIKRGKFVTEGHPVIYCQQPGGSTKDGFRMDSYQGAEDLAKRLETITGVRKPDPNYDPKKDPDGSPKLIPGLPDDAAPLVAAGGVLALAVGAGVVIRRRK